MARVWSRVGDVPTTRLREREARTLQDVLLVVKVAVVLVDLKAQHRADAARRALRHEAVLFEELWGGAGEGGPRRGARARAWSAREAVRPSPCAPPSVGTTWSAGRGAARARDGGGASD